MTTATKWMATAALAAGIGLAAAPALAEEDAPKKGVTEVGDPLPGKLAAKGYQLTGDKERCFNVTRIRNSRPLDDFHLLFTLRNGDKYLNRLSNRCSGLKIEGTYTYTTGLAKLCKLEIITVLNTNTGTRRGSCGVGTFEKIEQVASAE